MGAPVVERLAFEGVTVPESYQRQWELDPYAGLDTAIVAPYSERELTPSVLEGTEFEAAYQVFEFYERMMMHLKARNVSVFAPHLEMDDHVAFGPIEHIDVNVLAENPLLLMHDGISTPFTDSVRSMALINGNQTLRFRMTGREAKRYNLWSTENDFHPPIVYESHEELIDRVVDIAYRRKEAIAGRR